MKKSLIILTATVLVGGTTIVSCKSNSDKKEDAVEKVEDANENLNEVKTEIVDDAILKANDAEWQTFKTEANKTITSNENRIADLKKAIKKPGTTFDAAFLKSIATMESKNNSLKTKITDYENNQTDWESFKREFNSDMNDIGKSLKKPNR